MLYASGFDEGYACFPVRTIDDVTDLPEGLSLVMHYHWLNKVFRESADGRAAAKAANRFLARVKLQKDRGHTIVWTVHNILSHAATFPEEEAMLRDGMARLADVLHIMNPDTVALCAPHYDLPQQKVVTVPHPSYHGVYGDYVCGAQARFMLDLSPDDHVFLLFGSLGPHKGTRQFLQGLDDLQERLQGRARILVAGAPGKPAFMEDIMGLIAGRSDVQLFQAHIDDQGVQNFFKAADVVVCPYGIGLNSGVMVTAAGFGRPVVVPHMMARACPGIDDHVFAFEAGNIAACYDACQAALEHAGSGETGNQPEAVLRQWARESAPRTVSRRFFQALRSKLEGDDG
jgi:glycosyltransferase involved in cell wall biosynthesis